MALAKNNKRTTSSQRSRTGKSKSRKKGLKLSWPSKKLSWQKFALFLIPFLVVGSYFVIRSFAAGVTSSGTTKNCNYGTRCYFWYNLEAGVAQQILNFRQANGVPAAINFPICANRAAHDWSNWMGNNDTLAHSPGANWYAGYCGAWSKWGENVGEGPVGSLPGCDNYDITRCPEEIFTAWKNSTPHRTNMLDPAWNRMGVGVIQHPGSDWWFTTEFAQQ